MRPASLDKPNPLRCLLIADDLTGGADTGAQFAKRGFSTLLITFKEGSRIDFSQHIDRDVLAINTDSRGLSPDKAFGLVSSLLRSYDEELFPIIYKKIDSTLRGNIGYETDAILNETNISTGFMTPSYPEQERKVVDGILMVRGKPLSLTEASSDAATPVSESCVYKLLKQQSRYKVGWVDLPHVASSPERLREAVEAEREKGNRIITFDAVRRTDLTHIADVAFSMERKPLFIGSAGLAEEVATKLSQSKGKTVSHRTWRGAKPCKHIFIVSGSASSVTHQQLKRVEHGKEVASFELSKSLLTGDKESMQTGENSLSSSIGNSLAHGHVILKTCSERLVPENSGATSIHLKIPKHLGKIALGALAKSEVNVGDLALIVTGGDTAMALFDLLGAEGIEIEGEILDGIVMGHLIGGDWHGLSVITKAGAFGRENALQKVVDILERGAL